VTEHTTIAGDFLCESCEEFQHDQDTTRENGDTVTVEDVLGFPDISSKGSRR